MQLHHLALGAHDVEGVARFYCKVLGLSEERRHHTQEGVLRSIWLDLGGARLMIEHTDAPRHPVEGIGRGPFLIAVEGTEEERKTFEAALQAAGGAVEDRTTYTSYGRDPEGNRVAVSTFPPLHAGPS